MEKKYIKKIKAARCRAQDVEGVAMDDQEKPAWGDWLSWQLDHGDQDPGSGSNQVSKLGESAHLSACRQFSVLGKGSR